MSLIKYKLYSSKQFDKLTIEDYREHLRKLISSHSGGSSSSKSCDVLNLEIRAQTPTICHGKKEFGEDIEEEWFIVWCLYKLSKYDPQLVIQVSDKDGEILLVEAAEHLPEWLESSQSKDRAFIYNGELHILPQDIQLENPETSAQLIRSNKHKTRASSIIQATISEQLHGMPDKKAWLSKKMKQLDSIVFDNNEDLNKTFAENLNKSFTENLNLASVMKMNNEDLDISPLSTPTESSTSSWTSVQEGEEE